MAERNVVLNNPILDNPQAGTTREQELIARVQAAMDTSPEAAKQMCESSAAAGLASGARKRKNRPADTPLRLKIFMRANL